MSKHKAHTLYPSHCLKSSIMRLKNRSKKIAKSKSHCCLWHSHFTMVTESVSQANLFLFNVDNLKFDPILCLFLNLIWMAFKSEKSIFKCKMTYPHFLKFHFIRFFSVIHAVTVFGIFVFKIEFFFCPICKY